MLEGNNFVIKEKRKFLLNVTQIISRQLHSPSLFSYQKSNNYFEKNLIMRPNLVKLMTSFLINAIKYCYLSNNSYHNDNIIMGLVAINGICS